MLSIQEQIPLFQSSLGITSTAEIQDLTNSLLLSECVYKADGEGTNNALAALNSFVLQFPNGCVTLERIQFSRKNITHRYMLGAAPGALYVCFMGTKELRDFMADSNLLLHELWKEGKAGPAPATAGKAHRGFLSRSQGIPIEALYLHARQHGLRLILCGHSLGGAVAALCMLRLLTLLHTRPSPAQLRCLCFGCPAFGNDALATHVHSNAWDPYFISYSLPEDPVPKLFIFRALQRSPPHPHPSAPAQTCPAAAGGHPPQSSGGRERSAATIDASAAQHGGPTNALQHAASQTGSTTVSTATMAAHSTEGGSSGQERFFSRVGAAVRRSKRRTGGLQSPEPSQQTAATAVSADKGRDFVDSRAGEKPGLRVQPSAGVEKEGAAGPPGKSQEGSIPPGETGRLAWATGRLLAMRDATKAGASRLLPSYPTLPAYTHFGTQVELLPPATSSRQDQLAGKLDGADMVAAAAAMSAEAGATSASESGPAGGGAPTLLRRPFLAGHRMFSYRARLVDILVQSQRLARQQEAQRAQRTKRQQQRGLSLLKHVVAAAVPGGPWRAAWSSAGNRPLDGDSMKRIIVAELAPAVAADATAQAIMPPLQPLLAINQDEGVQPTRAGARSPPSHIPESLDATPSARPTAALDASTTSSTGESPGCAAASAGVAHTAADSGGWAGERRGNAGVREEGRDGEVAGAGNSAGLQEGNAGVAGGRHLKSSMRWRWKWRPRLAHDGPAGSAQGASLATASPPTRPAGPPLLLPVHIAVQGAGLDGCTAARLRLPDGAVVGAHGFRNQARERAIRAVARPEEGPAPSGWRSHARATVQSLLSMAPNRFGATWSRVTPHPHLGSCRVGAEEPPCSGATAGAVPGLLLEFAVPAAALSMLRLLPSQTRQQPISQDGHSAAHPFNASPWAPAPLLLLTDFGGVALPLSPSPQAVWLLGPAPGLCQAVFTQLEAAWKLQDALLQQGHPSAPSTDWLRPLRGLPSAAGVASSAAGRAWRGAASVTAGMGMRARAATRRAKALAAREKQGSTAPDVVEGIGHGSGALSGGNSGGEDKEHGSGGWVKGRAAAGKREAPAGEKDAVGAAVGGAGLGEVQVQPQGSSLEGLTLPEGSSQPGGRGRATAADSGTASHHGCTSGESTQLLAAVPNTRQQVRLPASLQAVVGKSRKNLWLGGLLSGGGGLSRMATWVGEVGLRATQRAQQQLSLLASAAPFGGSMQRAQQAAVQGLTVVEASAVILGEQHSKLSREAPPAMDVPGHREALRRLQLVAAALQMMARQRLKEVQQEVTGGRGACPEDADALFAELADAEVADEDLLMWRQLGAAAKLRRRVSQASQSLRHRAALRTRWAGLRGAPRPDHILLVIHRDLLPPFLFDEASATAALHPSTPRSTHAPQPGGTEALETPSSAGSGAPPAASSAPRRDDVRAAQCAEQQSRVATPLAVSATRPVAVGRLAALTRLLARPPRVDAGRRGTVLAVEGQGEPATGVAVLSEMQRVVALGRACGCSVLLVVAGRAPLGAGSRRRLAASVGLVEGGAAAVIPVALPQNLITVCQGGVPGDGRAAEGVPGEGKGEVAAQAAPREGDVGCPMAEQQAQGEYPSGLQPPFRGVRPRPWVAALQAGLHASAVTAHGGRVQQLLGANAGGAVAGVQARL